MEGRETVGFLGTMMNNPNSNDVLFGSFRKEYDSLTPKEVALLEIRRDNGLTKSPSEGTRSETETSTNSVIESQASMSAYTFLPPSVVTRASQASWRKGLMVLERRQKERGIIDPSLSILTEGSKFSDNSITSNTYLSADNTKAKIASGGTSKRGNPANLYDQLMENPSQILGISTSSSGTLEEDEASLESRKMGAVRLTKNYACTTTSTAGGSFDMIAFHDIKSPPTASELSQSSECWDDEKRFTDANEFTSTDDMKKKFQNYIELSGLNAKPRENTSGSITWSSKSNGSQHGRKKKWAKSKAKAVRSFRRTKTRLILKAANLQLSAQEAVEKLKKTGQKQDKANMTICETNTGRKHPVQQRMKNALSKKVAGVSSKALSKKISRVSQKILPRTHKNTSESALHSIEPVASASGNIGIALQAYQDPTNSLKSPVGKPPGVASMAKKKIAPLNKYIQRKSLHCKAGTSRAISKLRQSVKTQYKHIGDKLHPETESAVPPLVADTNEDAVFPSPQDDEKEEMINDSDVRQEKAQGFIPDPMAKETDVVPENTEEYVEPMETSKQTRLIPSDIALDAMKIEETGDNLHSHGSGTKAVESLKDAMRFTSLTDTTPVMGLNDTVSSFNSKASTVPEAEYSSKEDNRNKPEIAPVIRRSLSKGNKCLADLTSSPAEDNEPQIKAIDLAKQPSAGEPGHSDSVAESKSDHHEISETKAKIVVAELFDVGVEDRNGIEVSEDNNSYDEIDVIPNDVPNGKLGIILNQTENIATKSLSLAKLSSKMKRMAKRHSWHSKNEPHIATGSKSPTAVAEDNPSENGSDRPQSGKSKRAKISIPKMIPRPKKAHIVSRTANAPQKINDERENTIHKKLQEPSQPKDVTARPIPDILPLSEKDKDGGGSCAGSKHSAGGVSASIAETNGENVEMVAEVTVETDLDGVHANFVHNGCEVPTTSSSVHSEAQQKELLEHVEQRHSHSRKEKGSMKLRAMSFLKSRKRMPSGAAYDSHSNLPRSIDEANIHHCSEAPQVSKLTDSEAATLRTADGDNTEADKKAIDESPAILTSVSVLASPKEEAKEMEIQEGQEPRRPASDGKEGFSLQESACSGTGESSIGTPAAFLPHLSWFVPSFFCGANDSSDIPEGWVDGCGGGMDSNGLGSLSSTSTLSSDAVVRHIKKDDTPYLNDKNKESLSVSDAGSPELLLNKILSFNCYGCEDGCDDGEFDLADSLSSVTDDSNLVGTIIDTIVDNEKDVKNKPVLPKIAITPPRKANGEADAKNAAPSQWIEFKERQTKIEKVHQEKTATARRGVTKLLRLVKRKPKSGKAADSKNGNGIGVERQDKEDPAAAADNGQNEASLVSYLSQAGVSAAQSWGNNSDVFSGVVSRTSPRRKIAPLAETS